MLLTIKCVDNASLNESNSNCLLTLEIGLILYLAWYSWCLVNVNFPKQELVIYLTARERKRVTERESGCGREEGWKRK